MASCGVRDVIKFLVKNRMVDCIVATAGGIEEDFIKCLAPTYIGKGLVKISSKLGIYGLYTDFSGPWIPGYMHYDLTAIKVQL